MKAIAIEALGGADQLHAIDMPVPTPGPNDLLIEVHACGMNPVDFKVRSTGLGQERTFPLVMGYDVSGVVRGLGDHVEGFNDGDEVFASPSLARAGANAEFVCVDARTAARKPMSLDHVQAAALPLAGITAWESLDRIRLRPAQTILIHAGAGGVGHLAIQLAKHRGLEVITTAGREETIALCHRAGADHVINYHESSFVARVTEITEGRGCDGVFETVGAPHFNDSMRCVGVNGQLVTIVGSDPSAAAELLFRKNASIHFEFMGVPTIYGIRPQQHGDILQAMAALVDDGVLKPHVGMTLPLDELRQAHEHQETKRAIGKTVLTVK